MGGSGGSNCRNGEFEEIKAVTACLALALCLGLFCGCSSLQPVTKSQSMTVTALGFPAITVVTTTSQTATNDGDDEGATRGRTRRRPLRT